MAKKIDYYQDFLKTIEIREKEIDKNKRKKLFLTVATLFTYLIAVTLFSLQNKDLNLLSFFNNKDKIKTITELDQRIGMVESKFDNLGIATSTNPSYAILASKIIAIENKNSYLYQTILSNPDSAITPKLLREEQDNVNEKVADLKSQVEKTNNLLSGIFITILLAILGYIVKQIWEAYFSKHKAIKE